MEELIQKKAALLDLYVSSHSVEEFLSHSSRILNNPLIILDVSYKILAHSDEHLISDAYWKNYVAQGFCSFEYVLKAKQLEPVPDTQENSYFFPCHVCKDTKLVMTLKSQETQIGYLIMLDSQHSLSELDQELFEILGKMLVERLGGKNSRRWSSKNSELVFLDLLAGMIHSNGELADRLEDKTLIKMDYWRILVCDLSHQKFTDRNYPDPWKEIQKRLQATLHVQFSAYFEDKLVFLYAEEQYTEHRGRLIEFAKTYDLNIGVSSSFSNLMLTSDSYQEAYKCVELADFLLPNKVLVEFYEVQLYTLLPDISIDQAFQKYTHPVLKRLLEYDLVNEADLFGTLYAYLLQHENINQTAICLSLHRNTVRYKLKRAVEIGEFSLDSSISLAQVLLSYQILSYYCLSARNEATHSENQLLEISKAAFFRNVETNCAACTIQSCEFRH